MQGNNRITWGDISFHSFIIAVISGVIVSFKYSPSSPFTSLEVLSGLIPWGEFFRRLHYFSAQSFLTALILHKLDFLKRNVKYSSSKWFTEVITLFPISFLLVFTGYILRGDKSGIFARDVAINLVRTTPLMGPVVAKLLFGSINSPRLYIPFLNHAVIFTLIMIYLLFWHRRLILPDTGKLIFTFIPNLIAVVIFNPSIGVPVNYPLDPVKGPWFFLGIQELVYEFNPFIGGILFPAILLLSLGLFRNGKVFKILFWFLLLSYILLTLIAGLLRGPGWQLIL